MTDRELEDRLRAWYGAEIGDVETAPPDLRDRVAEIPVATPPPVRALPRRRGVTLLAAAALLVVVGGLATGAGGFRFTAWVPLTPSDAVPVPPEPSPTATSTSSPSVSPTLSPTAMPDPAPTPDLAPGFSLAGTSTFGAGASQERPATKLADGRVLVTESCGTDRGGRWARGRGTGAELYDPRTGTFTATGSRKVERANSTATLLLDGRVLITGGSDCASPGEEGVWATAEVFDPATGTFSATGSMHTGRAFHTATLLADGRVLIAGGMTAELYDPATGEFSPTGSMTVVRDHHTATLLEDGRVLIVGGAGATYAVRASADLYDPGTGTFTATGSLTTARWLHTATRLADGSVLILGGRSPQDSAYDSAEVYDPRSGTFRDAGSMHEGRQWHTATLLDDGRVLITGGYWSDGQAGLPLSSTELYDPATNASDPIGSMGTSRAAHSATLLDDGRVLISGNSHIGREVSDAVDYAVLYQP